jgi:rhodanese-related sulfurtransferase
MPVAVDRDRVRELVGRDAQLIEVLPEEEYRADHLPGAISIPLTKLDGESAAPLDRRRPVIVYCADEA